MTGKCLPIVFEDVKRVSVNWAFQESHLLLSEVKADVAIKGVLAEESLISAHGLHKPKPLVVDLEVWSELVQVPKVSYGTDDAGVPGRQKTPRDAVGHDNSVPEGKFSQCLTEPADSSLLDIMLRAAAQQVEESGKTREIGNQERRVDGRVWLYARFEVFSNRGKVGCGIALN